MQGGVGESAGEVIGEAQGTPRDALSSKEIAAVAVTAGACTLLRSLFIDDLRGGGKGCHLGEGLGAPRRGQPERVAGEEEGA